MYAPISLIILCFGVVKVSAAYPETKVFFDGRERSWLTHVPSTIDPDTPVPLVVDLHGITHNKETIAAFSGFAEMASTEKFIVVWPDGLGHQWEFRCDTAFLRTVVSSTASNHKIDPRRIYFTGHSMGCMQSQIMARDASDIVAAVACFAGYLPSEDNSPFVNDVRKTFPGDYKPVSVLQIHGVDDLAAPHFVAKASFDTWSKKNGCTSTDTSTTSSYTLLDHTKCNGGTQVQLMSLPLESFRTKPDGTKYDLHFPYFKVSSTFDTSALAWDFLKAHQSDATTNTITGAKNTCTAKCAKVTNICDAGQAINPAINPEFDLGFVKTSCALFVGPIPSFLQSMVGEVKAACCDSGTAAANNANNAACVEGGDSTTYTELGTGHCVDNNNRRPAHCWHTMQVGMRSACRSQCEKLQSCAAYEWGQAVGSTGRTYCQLILADNENVCPRDFTFHPKEGDARGIVKTWHNTGGKCFVKGSIHAEYMNLGAGHCSDANNKRPPHCFSTSISSQTDCRSHCDPNEGCAAYEWGQTTDQKTTYCQLVLPAGGHSVCPLGFLYGRGHDATSVVKGFGDTNGGNCFLKFKSSGGQPEGGASRRHLRRSV